MQKQRPIKTTIVSPQIPQLYLSGGIGTFVGHFVNLLHELGDDVTVVYADPYQRRSDIDDRLHDWRDRGIKLIMVQSESQPHAQHPLPLLLSEAADRAIPDDTDIVYFADWRANGFYTVKKRKFQANAHNQIIITILHGCTAWDREGQQRWPVTYEDVRLEHDERYVVEHSDFVVAPSNYALNWVRQRGWRLPANGRSRVLTYPFFPHSQVNAFESAAAESFKRLLFYGRLDTRKGIDIFVDSLLALKDQGCMNSIREIVLLGGEGPSSYGDAAAIKRLLRTTYKNKLITAKTNLDTMEAQAYLRAHARESLVVIPSRAETLGFAVIEASLVDELNMICSNAGGIPEIFTGGETSQLFEPYAGSLTRTLQRWLEHGPKPRAELGHYDWKSANARWSAFHSELQDLVMREKSSVGSNTSMAASRTQQISSKSTVDVCVTYYNLGRYLPYLLDSLADQTAKEFNVFVINDGSTEQASVDVFQEMESKFASKDWVFVTTENQGVSRARNFAATLGTAEYICFMDADNVAFPNMIERFVESIEISKADLLTCYEYVFEGEGSPYVAGVPVPMRWAFAPIGNCPEAIVVGNPFGDLNAILRRTVFDDVGGFTVDSDRYVNREDLELFSRIALRGFKLDVIPEYLFFYRLRAKSRLRSTDDYLSHQRVLRVYEEKLREVGLDGLVYLATGLHKTIEANANFDGNQIHAQRWRIEELEAMLSEHQAWIAELEKARDWNDEQRQRWQQRAAEQAVRIDELEQRLVKRGRR